MEIKEIIRNMHPDSIVETIGKSIIIAYDQLMIRDPSQASQMIEGLRKWINNNELWKDCNNSDNRFFS